LRRKPPVTVLLSVSFCLRLASSVLAAGFHLTSLCLECSSPPSGSFWWSWPLLAASPLACYFWQGCRMRPCRSHSRHRHGMGASSSP